MAKVGKICSIGIDTTIGPGMGACKNQNINICWDCGFKDCERKKLLINLTSESDGE